MSLSVSTYWKKGLTLGYQPNMISLDKNRVMAINALSMIMIVAIIVLTLGLWITGVGRWYYSLPGIAVYAGGLWLNTQHRHSLAQHTLYIGTLLLVSIWAFTNRRVGIELGLIALTCSAPMIFKEVGKTIVSGIISTLAFFVYMYVDSTTPFTPVASINYPLFFTTSVFFSACIVFLQLILFRNLAQHYHRALQEKNAILEETIKIKEKAEAELSVRNGELNELTEQLKWIVKQKNNELQTYLDAINVNIYSSITDTRGNFVRVNEPLCKASGYSSEDLIGQHFTILNSGYHSDSFFNEMTQTLLSGNSWRGEVNNQGKNGSVYWTDQVIIPVRGKDNQVVYFLTIGLPITSRKISEEARERTLRLLESIAFKTSHNIRGPLARIQGLVNLIQKDMLEPGEYKFAAEKIKTCSVELNQATTDLVMIVNDYQELIVTQRQSGT